MPLFSKVVTEKKISKINDKNSEHHHQHLFRHALLHSVKIRVKHVFFHPKNEKKKILKSLILIFFFGKIKVEMLCQMWYITLIFTKLIIEVIIFHLLSSHLIPQIYSDKQQKAHFEYRNFGVKWHRNKKQLSACILQAKNFGGWNII